jgi:hypothetical protein
LGFLNGQELEYLTLVARAPRGLKAIMHPLKLECCTECATYLPTPEYLQFIDSVTASLQHTDVVFSPLAFNISKISSKS